MSSSHEIKLESPKKIEDGI